MKKLERLTEIIPTKRVCEEFRLIYELQGAQKAINFLARYYKIRRMKIIVDGRRVGNSDEASYDYETYTAYFKKKGLNRFNVLHEFYHHLANIKDWELSERREEREADRYADKFLRILNS